MFNEVTLTAVAWLILSAGLLTVVAGCLYILLWSVGKIVRLLGFWDDFVRVAVMYYREKKEEGKTRMTSMTPTEQDKELAEKIGNVLDDLLNTEMPARFHNTDWAEYTIARLITADRKRVELEARIDEIKKYCTPSIYQAARQLNLETPKTWEVAHELGLTPMMADGRIKELKAQQEEV